MSGNSTLAELSQEVVAQYTPSLINYYIQLSAAVLVFYDYLLILPQELSLIWTGKINLMKPLFLVNRYAGIMLQYIVLFLYFFKPASDTPGVSPVFKYLVLKFTIRRCSALNYIQGFSDVLSNIAIYSIFTLRTFAIYGKSWAVFFVLAIPALADVAANIWASVVETASAFPRQLQVRSSLHLTRRKLTASDALDNHLTNSVSTTIFDALVVILTVCRLIHLAKSSRETGIRGSLSYIFLRDGSAFYIAIFIPLFAIFALNASLVKDDNININFVAIDFETILIAFRNIAVNRLVLSLSHAANPKDDAEYRSRTGLEPISFARDSPLGNIGGLVRSDFDYVNEDEAPDDAGDEQGRNIDGRADLESQGNSPGAGLGLTSVGEIDPGELNNAVASRPGSGADIEEICG